MKPFSDLKICTSGLAKVKLKLTFYVNNDDTKIRTFFAL